MSIAQSAATVQFDAALRQATAEARTRYAGEAVRVSMQPDTATVGAFTLLRGSEVLCTGATLSMAKALVAALAE